MESLENYFLRALHATRDLTNNYYLFKLEDSVKKVSNAAQVDEVLAMYNKSLLELVADNNFALNAHKTNMFAQLLGEAYFYLLCKNKKVVLSRVKEKHKQAPDFKSEAQDIYFEVKTLSVVWGNFGIERSLENFLDSQIKIEDQLKEGKRIAFGETVVQPYGKKPYEKGKGPVTAVIETLINKSKQNIKKGQFPNDKSFLVLNLSLIPPFCTDNYVLKPAYCDNYLYNKCVSGELWMLAFAQPGAPILGIPEFEGMPAVESIMTKSGILSDSSFKFIAGILLMIHPPNRDAEIWGLYTCDKFTTWEDKEPDMKITLFNLTGTNWNDDKDTNGWQLNG